MADAATIFESLPSVPEEVLPASDLDARLAEARHPFVVRRIADDWPLVKAGLKSADAARDYLKARGRDRKFTVNIGQPGAGDRLFYDCAMGMNFRIAQGPLAEILDDIAANENKSDAPVIYLASVDLGDYFHGVSEENRLPLGNRHPIESIWIGSRTRVAAHTDVPNNLAVCAVGRRRFTLFPPEQFRNLYPGPVENTPAGRPISMVDFHHPDFAAHPRFREALAHGMVAELNPGDAIFVPSLYWHHVEGLSPFNILVNYWWRDPPAYLGKPEDALNHAILAIRDLPEADRKIWRELFEHYVFENSKDVTAHIPESGRGILARLTPETAGQIRAFLLRSLSR
ncbi:MAG: cupin-like domain-containing protein [Pseudomonadota bacterium]